MKLTDRQFDTLCRRFRRAQAIGDRFSVTMLGHRIERALGR